LAIVKFVLKGQPRTATSEFVVEKMKGVAPDPLRAIVVEVGGVTYPVKQVFSRAFGVDKADFISHQARSVLMRLGFEVSRIRRDGAGDGEEEDAPLNAYGVRVMTWVGVEARTERQALSLARQYATALSERQWDAADRLAAHGVTICVSAATHDVEDWADPPTREQTEAAWEDLRIRSESSPPTPEDTNRVTRIMAWQKAHGMST
jgi:hypothetical protein